MKFTSCLILCLLVAVSCKDSETLQSNTEYLVYISNKAGAGFDLYRNSVDGKQEVRLTNEEGWEWRPQFVSGSSMIVYNAQDTAGRFKMKAINLQGGSLPFEAFKLPEFAITQDRNWIAYTRKHGNETDIMVAKYASVIDSIQITSSQSYNGRPVWSRGGNLLAYISDRTGSNEVYVYDLISGITRRITTNKMTEKYITWSPNDSQLAVTMRSVGSENEIFIINLNNLEVQTLTNSTYNEAEIAWSLKGNHIAFHAKVEGSDDIYVLNIESKEVVKVTDGQGYYGEPTWVMK